MRRTLLVLSALWSLAVAGALVHARPLPTGHEVALEVGVVPVQWDGDRRGEWRRDKERREEWRASGEERRR